MNATTKQRRIIEDAFRSIPDIYDGFQLVSDNVYELSLEGEKRHRSGRSIKGFPATLAAKYFTVKLIAGYASGRDAMPEIRDIHRLRQDCVLAASYAADYIQLAEWARSVPADFWVLDCASLMAD